LPYGSIASDRTPNADRINIVYDAGEINGQINVHDARLFAHAF